MAINLEPIRDETQRMLGPPTPSQKGLSDNQLRALIDRHIRQSIDYIDGEIGQDRRQALDLYYAEPFGNEQEGRSAVVMSDVQDTIEAMMPSFMEIFQGGDETVRFEPMGPEDEQFTEQATDYVNWIWNVDNKGFENTHDWIKDALLQKNGVIKVEWDETPVTSRQTMTGINSLHLQQLMADPEVEILEHESREPNDEAEMMAAPDGEMHDLTIKRTKSDGRVKVCGIPPEEFLISRRAVNIDDAPFKCHKSKMYAYELLEMGFPEDLIWTLPEYDEQEYNEERQARFQDEEWLDGEEGLDPSMRRIWVYDCYLRVDYDGDGLAEIRNVKVAGSGYTILENVEVDDHPFVDITPIKMPHKFFGRSIADLVADVQKVKSTVQRQLLDNMYLASNNRHALSNQVDLESYLNNRPGAAVLIDGPSVEGHIKEIGFTPLGNWAYPLLEYWDGVRETRTGITRYNQGLDADSLNKTMGGISQILNQAQKRMLLIARVFAETGFKKAYKKILRLVVNHQDRERTIQLRNEWVPMEPKYWNAEMDASINVGLGHGTKEQQMQADMLLLSVMERFVAHQGGMQGPIVTAKNLYEVFKRMATNHGWKDADRVATDPEENPVEPPPDPKMLELQGKMQIEQAKLQGDMQKKQAEMVQEKQKTDQQLQIEVMQAEADAALKRAEAQFSAELERFKAEQEIMLQREIAAGKIDLEREITANKIQLEREKAGIQAEMKDRELQTSAEIERERTERETEVKREDAKERRSQDKAKAESVKSNGQSKGEAITVNVTLPEGKKKTKIERDKDGKITGATSE